MSLSTVYITLISDVMLVVLSQRSLFYVLHAFSLLCPSCGYVQGMGPIAATLLNYFEPEVRP